MAKALENFDDEELIAAASLTMRLLDLEIFDDDINEELEELDTKINEEMSKRRTENGKEKEKSEVGR